MIQQYYWKEKLHAEHALGFKQLRGMNLDWPCLVNNDLKLASLFVIACGEANVTRHCPVSRITSITHELICF